MKKYFFLLIPLMFNLSVVAQKPSSHQKTQADYERIFKLFVNFYNNNQADSINNLFEKYKDWTNERVKEYIEEYGTIVSFKYIGSLNNENDVSGNPARYFKLTFSKPAQLNAETKKFFGAENCFEGRKVHAAAIALTESDQIGGVRFPTCSSITDSLLAKY